MATRGIARTDIRAGSRHEGFLRHRNFRWLKIALVLSLLSLAAYVLVDVRPRRGGGSWVGYTLGTVAALQIMWLTLLGVRKRAMTGGRWSLKGWTSAHVYLGLSLLVVATLHSGFQFGWNVHTLAYALMVIVIVSGIYGVSVYAALPSALSDSRAEMTRPQMIDAVGKLDRQLLAAAQPLGHEDAALVLASTADDPFRGGLRARLTGRYPRCGTARALPALRRRAAAANDADKAALAEIVNLLERKAAALARIRRHMRLKALLEIWLYVHVPVTFALIAALIAHIVSVFFYW